MEEKEPKYIKKLIEHIDNKFSKTDASIKELETMIVSGFNQVHKKLDTHDDKFNEIDSRFDHIDSDIYEIKADIRKIEGHIGRYEIRAQNIEQILLQDHKPRIAELEKIVFA